MILCFKNDANFAGQGFNLLSKPIFLLTNKIHRSIELLLSTPIQYDDLCAKITRLSRLSINDRLIKNEI